MPTIPVYGGPQVAATALRPPVQSNIDVSSGAQAFARGLDTVGAAVEHKMLRDADAEANQVDQEITSGWLQWNADNRSRFQGQNAGEYEVEAKKWWDDARTKYGASASPIARQRVGVTLGRKQNQAMSGVLGHVNAEKERFADQQSESSAQTAIRFGINSGQIDIAREQIREITARKAARKGWTSDDLATDQARLLGVMHVTYLDSLVEQDAEKAQAYYNEHKTEIPVTVQGRVEKVIKAEADNQFASAFAAQEAGTPLEDQLKKAADIKDPERRKKTIEQIKVNEALVNAASREREQKASDEAWQLASQGQRVPERTLAQMNGRERAQLVDWQREKVKQLATGTPIKTDPVVLAGVYDLARDNPDAFKGLRMQALSTKVSTSDMEQIARLQRDMLDPTKEKDSVTLSQQLGAATKTIKHPASRAAFESAAHAEIIQFQEEKGRRPTQTERQTIINDLMTKGVLEDSFLWFDTERQKYQMTPEERERAVFPATPAATPTPQRAPGAPATDQYTVGRVYRDKNGNRAVYRGPGQWEPIK